MKLELDTKERELLVLEIEHIIPELELMGSGIRKDVLDEMRKEKEILKSILEKLKKAA